MDINDFLGKPLYKDDIIIFATSLGELKRGVITDIITNRNGLLEIQVKADKPYPYLLWKGDGIYKLNGG